MKSITYGISLSQPMRVKFHILACSYLTETLNANCHGSDFNQGISPVKEDAFLFGQNPISFSDACHVFEKTSDLTVVSATSIIGCFSKQDRHEEAIHLFSRMLASNTRPNEFTFGTVIHSSTALENRLVGKQLHGLATKTSLNSNVFVGSALLDFYVKLSTIEDAQKAFADTKHPNVVSYTTLICGYLKTGSFQYSSTWDWQKFSCMCNKDFGSVASWNSVICGYAQNGRGNEAIRFYKRMLSADCKPNDVTLLGLLWACNHAGLVDVGYSYFNQARIESPSLLKPEHYACMVDLLSRSGRFTEAKRFLHDMRFDPGIGFWKALLGGCQIHSNTGMGEIAARKILALDPDDISSYVMLSNAHSAAGRWLEVTLLREEMKKKGMKRIPGCSWIEVRNKSHIFLTADKNHCESDSIYAILRFLIEHSRENETSNLLTDL
ncbi:pentatricopeptide repeat-containing protein At5g42450, mitochondrial isoform X2 [Prosopis cineraria]|uniref:pentatricopeptide repeat-containing protein At5g42450, mitochondrial isoform X2 n=1 Tax=Prosopis cineraria TaxID=364024 RepID=UPI00240FBDC7|nr:pentatricopeptide repeat-containing protein At5g42450, mitochondrial isoform X2 [Prosopis cineraria]